LPLVGARDTTKPSDDAARVLGDLEQRVMEVLWAESPFAGASEKNLEQLSKLIAARKRRR